jgi:tRNA 2-thiouridine synthesizing protein A
MSIPEADHELDAVGLICPEPLMLVRNQVRRMQSGQVLHVIATDPSTRRDLHDFCRFLGHEMVVEQAAAGRYQFWIRKG